jgi:hypothetical protein
MSDEPREAAPTHSPAEIHSAMFAHLVMQQTNMAMMLLGKIAHPETGQVTKDLDAAKYFIDQLEMLEAKTKGNLSKEETSLLRQSLMNLQLNFVEAVETPTGAEQPKPQAAPEAAAARPQEAPPAGAEDEHRKKFSKKY